MDKSHLIEFNILAYKHGDYDIPTDWIEFTNSDKLNCSQYGFFGIVFKNLKTQEYIIAFSGTSFTNPFEGSLGWDLKTDYDIFINNNYETPQYGSGTVPFIKEVIKHIHKTDGSFVDTKITLTGHSLGASLADLSFFQMKYLGVKNVKVINFENPGSKPMIEKLLINMNEKFEKNIKIDDFVEDIEHYQSHDTFINTVNEQIGTVFKENIIPSAGWGREGYSIFTWIPYLGEFFNYHYLVNWQKHYQPKINTIKNDALKNDLLVRDSYNTKIKDAYFNKYKKIFSDIHDKDQSLSTMLASEVSALRDQIKVAHQDATSYISLPIIYIRNLWTYGNIKGPSASFLESKYSVEERAYKAFKTGGQDLGLANNGLHEVIDLYAKLSKFGCPTISKLYPEKLEGWPLNNFEDYCGNNLNATCLREFAEKYVLPPEDLF